MAHPPPLCIHPSSVSAYVWLLNNPDNLLSNLPAHLLLYHSSPPNSAHSSQSSLATLSPTKPDQTKPTTSPSFERRVKKRPRTPSSSPSFTLKKQGTPSCLPFGRSKGIREEFSAPKVVNLDFDARVPIPFSLFPSSYRNDAEATTTETHVEGEISLPAGQQRVGREGQYSSYSANLPPRDGHFRQEEVHISREEDRYRPSRREDIYVREERRPDHKHAEAHLDINTPHHRRHYEVDVELPHLHRPHIHRPHFHHDKTEVDFQFERRPHHHLHDTEIDITERQYRSKFQPSYREEIRVNETTVDSSRFQPTYREEIRVEESTVDPPRFRPTYKEEVHITEEIVDPPRFKQDKMVYYDEDVKVSGEGSSHKSKNTVTIPTHHIRTGDLLILQGRPCQVIKISTSASTGQHRYLGVDLFTRQLHEESSFISNPSPSVIVQTMLGPVFKQYRVLDLADGAVIAMTETGDVKQSLPVIDQSNLFSRLKEAFETGRGSVRVLVVSDHGRELVVDMKVLHGSRL